MLHSSLVHATSFMQLVSQATAPSLHPPGGTSPITSADNSCNQLQEDRKQLRIGQRLSSYFLLCCVINVSYLFTIMLMRGWGSRGQNERFNNGSLTMNTASLVFPQINLVRHFTHGVWDVGTGPQTRPRAACTQICFFASRQMFLLTGQHFSPSLLVTLDTQLSGWWPTDGGKCVSA